MSGGRGGVFVGMVEGYGRRLAAVVALLMAWTLAVTLLEVVAESPAQAAPEAPASAGDPAALQRPDVVSAMVTAQMLDKRVEVTGLRTETSLTFAHPDGTYSSEINARPVRVEQSDGTWRAVDTDLHRTPDGDVAPAETPVQVELSGDTAAATPALASLADEGKSASIGWSGKLPEPTLDGDTAVYTNVLPDVDLELRATAEGFAKLIIVKTPAAAAALGATVRLPLSGKGVMFSLGETGALLAKDSKGRVVFTAPAPIMWDATTDEGTGEATRQAPVGIALDDSGGKQTVVLTPDQGMLSSPDTKFPVSIDPGLTLSSASWSMVDRGYPTTSYYNSTDDAKVGTYNAGANLLRSSFGFVTSGLAGLDVQKATLQTNLVHSWSCTATEVRLFPITYGSKYSSSTTWDTQPPVGALADARTVAAGYSSACPAKRVDFDVTAEMAHVATNKLAAMFFQLRAGVESNTTTANTYWKKFDNNPSLFVSYNRPPTAVSPRSMVPAKQCLTGADRPRTNVLTPTLKGVGSDPDNAKTRVQFEIYIVGQSDVKSSGTTGYLPSGSYHSWTVPKDALVDNAPYQWRARAFDSRLWGPWSAWCEFTTDVTPPPNAPTVTADVYTADTWAGKAGTPGAFTFGANGGDVVKYIYTLDDQAPVTVSVPTSGAGHTATITPDRNGPHTLTVQGVDRADNLSPLATHRFKVGDGAVVSPAEGDVAGSHTRITADAPDTATAVTYQWTRADDGTFADIDPDDVTLTSSAAVSQWPLQRTAGELPDLNWNIGATLVRAGQVGEDGAALDGPIRLRAVFATAGGPTYSDPVKFSFDRQQATAAGEDVGPGSVNLLTGDLTIAETDVTADAFGADMTVARTYSTRRHGAYPGGPFGPGWASSVAVDALGVDYTGLTEAGATVAVLTGDGDTLTFVKNGAGTYVPELGLETLTLTKDSATQYTLTDREDGTTVVFQRKTTDAGAAVWVVASASPPGSSGNETRYAFDVHQPTASDTPVRRPTRMLAPTPGVTCDIDPSVTPDPLSLQKGCRMLVFSYDAGVKNDTTQITVDGTTAGPRADRINAVDLVAWDPAAAKMTRTTLARYAYDQAGPGRLRAVWDPRLDHTAAGGTLTHHADTYGYDADGVLATVTPYREPSWRLSYTTLGARPGGDVTPYGAADTGKGRLAQVTRDVPTGKDRTPQTAKTTVVYRVPVQGERAPYDLSKNQTEKWGQGEPPVEGTAVFGPDQVPTVDQAAANTLGSGDYTRATISYLDANGQEVNAASPSAAAVGAISTTTYDRWGNVVRSLTAGNRALALADPNRRGSTVAADELSTRNIYDSTGQQLLETFDPRHSIAVPDGSGGHASIDGRAHTVTTYETGTDPNNPTGGSFSLPVSETSSARLDDGTDVDVRTTRTAYDWTLRQPTSVTVENGNGDGTGPATTRTSYDPKLGLPVKVTAPAGGTSDTTPSTTVTTYYTADNTGGTDCGSKPEWAGLTCKTAPGGQPAGTALPLEVTKYNRDNQPTVVTETTPAGSVLRRTLTRYDSAGRPEYTAVTASAGTALPAVRTIYDAATGEVTATQSVPLASGATFAGDRINDADLDPAASPVHIGQETDDLGRVVSYTDAGGTTSTTTYDVLGRVVETSDGKGTQTRSYDEATGQLTRLGDSEAGAFEATYDIEGKLLTEKGPNGVTAATTYDETGTPIELTYTSAVIDPDTGEPAILAHDRAEETIHGQQATRSSTLGYDGAEAQVFGYDAAGRLTTVRDTVDAVTGTTCTTRRYTFDDATNRTALSVASADGDSCPAPSTTAARTWTYDTADRHTSAGYTPDAFGRFTTVPAVDTPTGKALTIGYHANDLVRSLSDGARATTYTLDVDQTRIGSWTDAGDGATITRVHHYDGGGDGPAWTEENTTGPEAERYYTRNVGGIGGDLSVIHHSSTGDTFQVANLHGDVVGTTGADGTLTSANGTADEHGNPRDVSTIGTRRYGWLGTKQRAADTPGGLTLMGVRVYNPTTGRFLQTDPVKGGSANAYDYVYQDPINKFDLDGRCWGGGYWCHPVRRGARMAYRQGIRLYAVIPYAQYYGGYRYNRWASKRSRWNPAHLLRPVGWWAQAEGISRDAAVDWVKGHTGFHESIYDEHQRGHLNPLHRRGRGRTWLPGLYRRGRRIHLDWAW